MENTAQNRVYSTAIPSGAWSKLATSPREIGQLKAFAVCKWIYRWGYTSAEIIEIIGRSKRKGLAARLVKKGVLKKTRTPSGGYLKGEAQHMYTLSEQGLQIAQHVDPDVDLDYQLNPHNRSLLNFRHDLICQMHVIGYYHLPQVIIEPESAIKVKSVATKQADCLLRYPAKGGNQNFRHAIEVELTKKHGRALHEFILKVWLALKPESDAAALAENKRLQSVEIENVKQGLGSKYYVETGKRDAEGFKERVWDWSSLPLVKVAKKGVLWDAVDIVYDIDSIKTDYWALMQEGAVIKTWARNNLKWVVDPKKSIIVTREMAEVFRQSVRFKTLGQRLTTAS
jgi:hypothetical protein